ncbi:3,4-dihydroxy-2-butanone-4-phosphate synthase [Methylopila turkensis]|nr:3,4-dihydroxy-2-butanone-4-phosphate synthase [Methylopila turkensis]
MSQRFSPAGEIVAAIARGEMVILVDDEDRENEGDLVVAAQFATPAAINFMATHGRGLICLALTPEHVDRLGLIPMAARNTCPLGTAFTVSVEAREGVTTGISAFDRAHTIATVIDPAKGAGDLVSPGHVFPLRARIGGLMERAGHTEAAVDVSKMAGLIPAGVICEIMSEDGRMARTPELLEFARTHGLLIGSIASLITYAENRRAYFSTEVRHG